MANGWMCRQYKRQSAKQRIGKAFVVSVGLEELVLDPKEESPTSVAQAVLNVLKPGTGRTNCFSFAVIRFYVSS